MPPSFASFATFTVAFAAAAGGAAVGAGLEGRGGRVVEERLVAGVRREEAVGCLVARGQREVDDEAGPVLAGRVTRPRREDAELDGQRGGLRPRGLCRGG